MVTLAAWQLVILVLSQKPIITGDQNDNRFSKTSGEQGFFALDQVNDLHVDNKSKDFQFKN